MEKLIERAKKGDSDAFTDLMQSQMRNMYRVARAILMNDEDTADAIQETILVCFEKLNTLRENKYFKTWLTRILINKCYDIIRRNQEVIYTEELPERATEKDICNLELKEALNALDEKYRLVIVLFYAEGFHTDEIAKMLNIPGSTVRTRLSRARAQMADYYKDNIGTDKEKIV